MADDLGERTEPATPKRRQEAREEGQVARSHDLAAAIMLLLLIVTLFIALMPLLGRLKTMIEAAFDAGSPQGWVQAADLSTMASHLGAQAALAVAGILAAAFFAALLAHGIQIGWLVSAKAAAPRLSKVNPIHGLRRLLSPASAVKAGLDSLKVIIVIAVAATAVIARGRQIIALPQLTAMQALGAVGWMLLDLSLRVVAVLLLLGLLDFIYQRFRHERGLRMTRQQVKDEMKQSEGDPDVKKRRYRMQQQIALQRITAAVPRADVVVTNPEHISVAIQYDAEAMNAPKVVAKGADFLAMRIRQIAMLHRIPIVERPPLARALYRHCQPGQEIPPQFYKAVAEILAYVYRLSATGPGPGGRAGRRPDSGPGFGPRSHGARTAARDRQRDTRPAPTTTAGSPAWPRQA